jgi:hypothetical protein
MAFLPRMPVNRFHFFSGRISVNRKSKLIASWCFREAKKCCNGARDGPAVLKLGRKDGETKVNLVTRNPDAAAKAGIAAKPGQAKLLISNPNEVEATITINKQTIKATAGTGMKGPDGPTLELAPGKYKFTVKLLGKPASEDELQVGADETWGVLIGPGGALPIHVH